MDIDLIKTSLEYYDSNREKYRNFMKKIKQVAVVEKDYSYMLFADSKGDRFFSSRCEIFGTYSSSGNVWAWAWSNPLLKPVYTHTITKVLNYGIGLSPDSKYLKTELITSRFRISSKTQLEIHMSIASYLAKKPLVFGIAKTSKDKSRSAFEFLSFDDISDTSKLPEGTVIWFYYILDPPDMKDYQEESNLSDSDSENSENNEFSNSDDSNSY